MPSTESARHGDGTPRVAHLQLAILTILLAAQISTLLAGPMPPRQLTASLAAVTALAVLQARHLRAPARSPLWLRLGLVSAEGLTTYLPLLAIGAAWPGMGGFLAASVLLVLPGRAAWPLVAAVIMGLFAAAMSQGLGVRNSGNVAIASLAVGLTLFGVCHLTSTIMHMRGMHTEATQLAVVKERLRFARDLHDLLGYNLAAITLKAELSRRLIRKDPAAAGDELRDVVDIARQAVAEVRHVVDGYRNISLAQEIAAAASLLASADVAARVEMSCGILPDKVDSVLAMVLRELTTNILRHSTARNCWITAVQADEHITLSVANDGVPRAAANHRDGGGLENLASRLEAVGGTLSATVCDDGRFRVLAEIAI
ncbi:hypothetical protein Psuf_070700 [Phytohabitans suffuscus]|uniref:Signal transduction histidine kinase subgroup 3 dimerisation and phosphoacceptor domain-containing protein n=1 Tax=Phytohabitans suffuscus TaxID=624315 RepID=A0A6F8YUE3_9ACTN|nr:hypothetical protein Psuf_070700 [Phytohabitans suffuscus]